MDGARTGFTTGTCAAAAALAAGRRLLGGHEDGYVEVVLPGGDLARLRVEYCSLCGDCAVAGVRKDAGDDPDITHEALICAQVRRIAGSGIIFRAGDGVGTVRRPGLQLPVGEAAINPVPRQMIAENLRALTTGGLEVTISVPGGEDLARKTFNPRLGIEGGISIIGTSGIVRPFSTEAVREAILCTLRVAAAAGANVARLVPGHYGMRAALELPELCPPGCDIIEVGNEWDYALPLLKGMGFSALLALGHPGKLGKLAAGYFNTHSRHSPPALDYVRELAHALGIESPDQSATVEGFFAALSEERARKIAGELARRVAAAVGECAGLPARVGLIDMKGRLLALSY